MPINNARSRRRLPSSHEVSGIRYVEISRACLWLDCGWVESNTDPRTWICRGEFLVTDWTWIDCDRGMCVTTEKSRTIRDRGKNVESFWLLHGRGYHVEMSGCCREIDRQLPGDSSDVARTPRRTTLGLLRERQPVCFVICGVDCGGNCQVNCEPLR